ncbi:arylsulfatase [bacterium]|nr:arylsulfatase [bacterium]
MEHSRSFRVIPVLLLASFFETVNAADIAAPNVILIVADDLGYGDLGCYGQKEIKTPCLDRLATEGTRFTDFYAGSTVCAPSRCVLMTGLHTGHARVRGNALVPLLPEDVTLAEIFKARGYHTGMFGKWGLGEPGSTGIPNKQGFDEWFGYLNQGHAHNYYPEFLWRNESQEKLPGNKAVAGVAIRKGTYSQDLFLRESLAFLAQNKDRPFFLYLPWTLPHANNEAGRVKGNGMEIPSLGEYASKSWPEPEKGRAAMISRLDADVGKIVEKVAELGLAENTLILFTSDNGPHAEGNSMVEFFDSNGPLRGSKRDLYEGGIRVPLIVRWKGHVPVGKTNDTPWGFVDMVPTLAALIDAEVPKGTDGVSMLSVIEGRNSPEHPPLYWEFHERGFDQAVRMGSWKGVRHGMGPIELYDLKTDISEEHNVASDHADIVHQMTEYLATARTESEHWPVDTTKQKQNRKRPTAAKAE